jgi:hypothetical protein
MEEREGEEEAPLAAAPNPEFERSGKIRISRRLIGAQPGSDSAFSQKHGTLAMRSTNCGIETPCAGPNLDTLAILVPC